MTILIYPKCSTCNRVLKVIDEKKHFYIIRDIVKNNPTTSEIKSWINKYNIDINILFNTRGTIYKDQQLSQKMSSLSFDEKVDLLASNGMLVKRPILLGDDFILIGAQEIEKWA